MENYMKEQKLDNCIPLMWEKKLTTKYPMCWEDVEDFRQGADKGEVADWDKTMCYIPITATLAITSAGNDLEYIIANPGVIDDAALMAAIAPWRKAKQIYEFAPEIERLLAAQADDCEIPIEVLRNLPYKSIYIKTSIFKGLDGAFVHIEHDVNSGRKELRLTLVWENGLMFFPISIHLIPSATLREGIKEMRDEANRVLESVDFGEVMKTKFSKKMKSENMYDYVYGFSAPFIQLILYLCAQNSEVEFNHDQEKIIPIPKSRASFKDRYGEVRNYRCGEVTARQIQMYNSTNATNRTYIRQDHVRSRNWDHSWSGTGDRKTLVLKWRKPDTI